MFKYLTFFFKLYVVKISAQRSCEEIIDYRFELFILIIVV